MKDKYFGIDERTFNLIIDYFKLKDEIKFVKIYGSRYRAEARPSSDIDLLVEGTFKHEKIYEIKQEINNLKHPYRIDFVDVYSTDAVDITFVRRNFYVSEIIYARSDYFPNETYKKITGVKKIEHEGYPRWVYRYFNYFGEKLKLFLQDTDEMISYHENNIDNINYQIELFGRFKNIFEGCWKVYKDYLKEILGIKLFLPREIFEVAEQKGLLEDKNVWFSMIDDFKIMTDYAFVDINDEMIYKLKTYYIPAIKAEKEYFKKEYLEHVKDNKLYFNNQDLNCKQM